MTALYVPGTDETDPKKIIMSQQLVAGQTTTNTTAIAAISASYITSINTRTGAITLNATSGITNTLNDIIISPASSSQFGAVKVDNTTITAAAGVISVGLSKFTNSLGADVLLNNVGTYFTGPTVAQGTTGTWFASGTVTVVDTAGAASINAKLWDGTTVIASASVTTASINFRLAISLSGYITSPAGNIRISCQDTASTSGKILFNQSGNSLDSTLSAIRIA